MKRALCLAPLPEGRAAARLRGCQRLKGHEGCHQTRFRAWFEGEKESRERSQKATAHSAESEVRLTFNGASGRQPRTEARLYVYRIIAMMLDHELEPDQREGWMFGGIEHEPDQRRLRKAIKAVQVEMRRKADR